MISKQENFFRRKISMVKKLLCLILAAVMLFGVLAMTGCSLFGEKKQDDSDDRLPTTLNFLGITEGSTTPEATAAVEEELNKILVARYKTKIKLTLVTEDEYYDLIDKRIAEKEHLDNIDSAILQYNKYMQSLANEQDKLAAALAKKSSSKWRKEIRTPAETISTRIKYLSEQTTVDEGGIISIVYPDPESPIDIVMISGKEMYDRFDEDGVIKSLETYLNSSDGSFSKFSQYIYPTYFSQLSATTGGIKAIPSNNLLAEYTYIVVRKDLADKYSLNYENISNYADLSDFLASVKQNEGVRPMKNVPEALGIFYPFGKDVAIAAYADPIYGYNVEENKKFTINNLFDIPEYTDHLKLMSEYEKLGYFEGDEENYAVAVIVGDASVADAYGDEYYVQLVQNPFVTETDIFEGMMAVSEYTSSAERSLEIIQAINTTPELKNLLQYGIKDVNYKVNDDGLTIKRLNSDYAMKTALTGNVYMGYPDEGQNSDQWKYYKLTNLSSLLSPFLTYYLNDSAVDAEISSIFKRFALEEAFRNVGTTYDWYLENATKVPGQNKLTDMKWYYKDYLIECLKADGVKSDFEAAVKGNKIRSDDWLIGKIVDKLTAEKYANIVTSAGIDVLTQQKLTDILGVSYAKQATGNSFAKYRDDAKQYFTNIKYLRIMADMLIFTDMDEAEKAKFDAMSDIEFEEALLAVVTESYIKKNDLTEEKYSDLVKTYISSLMEFYDDLGNKYLVSWDDLASEHKNAEPFIEAVEKLKAEYADLLAENRYNTDSASATPIKVAEKIHELLYLEWLKEQGVTMAEFQNGIYDEIFAPYGMTKAEADALKKKDQISYDSYISRIKSKYKSAIKEVYSAEKYREKGSMALTSSEILEAVFNYLIEKKTQIYHTMCEKADISYSEFITTRTHMESYIKYVNMMKTKNTQTLRIVYTQSQINNFKYDEIQDIVFDVIHDVGYYTNEMVKLVGSTLADYTNAKTNAAKYIEALNKLIDHYSSEITALGYDLDAFRNMDPEVIESVIYDIARKECSEGKVTIEDYMKEVSKKYVEGVATAEDVEQYCKDAAEALHNEALFDAIPKELDRAKEESLAEKQK